MLVFFKMKFTHDVRSWRKEPVPTAVRAVSPQERALAMPARAQGGRAPPLG